MRHEVGQPGLHHAVSENTNDLVRIQGQSWPFKLSLLVKAIDFTLDQVLGLVDNLKLLQWVALRTKLLQLVYHTSIGFSACLVLS